MREWIAERGVEPIILDLVERMEAQEAQIAEQERKIVDLRKTVSVLERELTKLARRLNKYAKRILYLMGGIDELIRQIISLNAVPCWKPEDWDPDFDDDSEGAS